MNKIQALRKTAENLRTGKVEYNWEKETMCNCGVLAATVINANQRDYSFYELIEEYPLKGSGIFSARAKCLTTGLPLNKLWSALKEAGFTEIEMQELEFLGDERVLNAIGLRLTTEETDITLPQAEKVLYADKQTVIRYLDAWADILESEQIKYEDITKQLAVLPINETADQVIKLTLVK